MLRRLLKCCIAMTLTHEEKEKIISFLKSKMSLRLLILFGSYASGHAAADSDIDLAFIADNDIDDFALWWDISRELSLLIGHDVDLVDMKKASTVFRFEIVSNGQILFQEGDFDAYLDLVYTLYLQLNDDRQEVLAHYEEQYHSKQNRND